MTRVLIKNIASLTAINEDNVTKKKKFYIQQCSKHTLENNVKCIPSFTKIPEKKNKQIILEYG